MTHKFCLMACLFLLAACTIPASPGLEPSEVTHADTQEITKAISQTFTSTPTSRDIVIMPKENVSPTIFSELISDDQSQIQEVIHDYFEIRYKTRSNLDIDEIRGAIEDFPKEPDCQFSELDKLEIELFNSELNHLRYLSYKYFLDFTDISFNGIDQAATAIVIEGHDVVFEATSPIVSSMRNQRHVITLQKSENNWEITSDLYNDDLWKMLRTTQKTKEEIFATIQKNYR